MNEGKWAPVLGGVGGVGAPNALAQNFADEWQKKQSFR